MMGFRCILLDTGEEILDVRRLYDMGDELEARSLDGRIFRLKKTEVHVTHTLWTTKITVLR